MISRTGYSGERGYEIFAEAEDIVSLWDAILEDGKPEGILPCSINCIEILRVESALLDYPLEKNESDTPWNVGLGYAVSKKKRQTIGAQVVWMQWAKKQKQYGELLWTTTKPSRKVLKYLMAITKLGWWLSLVFQ